MSPHTNQRGFTLIEVLITMSLLGVFFTLLGGVMVQQIRTTEKVSEQAFLQQDVRHALAVISTAIRKATDVQLGIGNQVVVITQAGVTKYILLTPTSGKQQVQLFNDYTSNPDTTVNLTSDNTDVTDCSVTLQPNGLWKITVDAQRVLKSGVVESFTLTSEVGERIKGFN